MCVDIVLYYWSVDEKGQLKDAIMLSHGCKQFKLKAAAHVSTSHSGSHVLEILLELVQDL